MRYGFITPEDGDENVFVDQSSIKDVGCCSLASGDAFEFVIPVAGKTVGPPYNFGFKRHPAMDNSYPKCFIIEPSDYMTEAAAAAEKKAAAAAAAKAAAAAAAAAAAKEEGLKDMEFLRGVEQRNWAELPRDVLWMIFEKIAAVDIIRSAQYVCRPWRHLSYEPELWRHIVVTIPEHYMDGSALKSLIMLALDRSEGCVEDFQLEGLTSISDELIGCLSNRSYRTTKLRRLRIISIYTMSETALAQAIRKLPLLEELEISRCFFSSQVVEVIGPACSQLKSFKFSVGLAVYNEWNIQAFSIAKHMQQLQHLELIGDCFTNIGLLAILNNCPNLQRLDIRNCTNIDFDEDLRRKCANIKELRYHKGSYFKFTAFINHDAAFDSNFIGFGAVLKRAPIA